jgi:hypothetical protein
VRAARIGVARDDYGRGSELRLDRRGDGGVHRTQPKQTSEDARQDRFCIPVNLHGISVQRTQAAWRR